MIPIDTSAHMCIVTYIIDRHLVYCNTSHASRLATWGVVSAHKQRICTASAPAMPRLCTAGCQLCCAVCTGINSFFAGLAGSLPNTTFAQNNGVLSLTRCASRSAGYSCGVWLFLFGVLAKVPCTYLDLASGLYGHRFTQIIDTHVCLFACAVVYI